MLSCVSDISMFPLPTLFGCDDTYDAAGPPRTFEHVETVRTHDSQVSCSGCGSGSLNKNKMVNERVCWMNVLVRMGNGRLRCYNLANI